MHARTMSIAFYGLLALTLSQPISAQQLLFHFPLDGTAEASGWGAREPSVHLFNNGTAPRTVPGRFGDALYFDGNATISMPFELDMVTYPQVTVTAWVKVDAGSTGERTIFSSGNGNVPRLMMYTTKTAFHAARGTDMASTAIAPDEWVFVAGTVDVGASRLQVFQGDLAQTRERINTGSLYPPTKYRNPDDASLPAMPYVFIGSHGFSQWRASSMAIDDVRVYAGVLSAEQIAGLRAGEAIALTDSAAAPAFYDAGLTEETVDRLAATRAESAAPVIVYESEEAALAAAERREQEAAAAQAANEPETPMQAGRINAVMDLQKIRIREQQESGGDEYYLVIYRLRGQRGTGDRIYTFDYQRQVWPIAAGENWAVRGSEFTIPQEAGRLSFTNVEPFEVYGFVAVLMEANGNTDAQRQAAFGFGEFQNESGVTEVVGSAFDRAIPRDGQRPNYGDTTCTNVRRVADQNAYGLKTHFDFLGMPSEGLAQAIQDALREPLQRTGNLFRNPDRYDGAIWGFFMNTPGGPTCGGPFYRDADNYNVGIFPVPGRAPVEMRTENTTIYVEHR